MVSAADPTVAQESLSVTDWLIRGIPENAINSESMRIGSLAFNSERASYSWASLRGTSALLKNPQHFRGIAAVPVRALKSFGIDVVPEPVEGNPDHVIVDLSTVTRSKRVQLAKAIRDEAQFHYVDTAVVVFAAIRLRIRYR